MAKPLLFIVNPKSGTNGTELPALLQFIEDKMKELGYVCQTVVTEFKGHATQLASTAVKSGSWSAIVAVGGDGTINEVARAMLFQSTPMGIVPAGSGNGLARHLHIPVNTNSALHRLVEGTPVKIDSGLINDTPFFCTSGIGFDASVSHYFASSESRGLRGYIRFSLEAYKDYRPITVTIDDETLTAFLITFANAGQYGNNAWIAPKASVTDGILDLCYVQPFPDWYSMILGARLFAKTLDQSQYVSYRQFQCLRLTTTTPLPAHFDGEPLVVEGEVIVRSVPGSLTVIC